MHKRTLEPIKTMLYGLRRYDQDRCAAMGFGNDLPADLNASDAGLGVGVGAAAHHFGQEGYLSYNSKIYLVRGIFYVAALINAKRKCRPMFTTIWISC
jgi:hypothetical protein